MRFPPALKPGDNISVVAPSGPFDSSLLESGLARLEDFCVHVPQGMLGRQSGFFAGDFATRLQELQAALDDDSSQAIWIARGGYGIGPLIPHLSFDKFCRAPKWIVGFSDATVLHNAMMKHGVSSLHAPNGTTLAQSSPSEYVELLSLLQGASPTAHRELSTISPGVAQGRLCGGNLTVLFAEAAANRLKLPEGGILFLEDVTETSYRIDRMLSALIDGGHLHGLSGVVLGEFTDCSPGRFGVETASILTDRLARLGLPAASGLACGHGANNRPLRLGSIVQLDADRGQLSFA